MQSQYGQQENKQQIEIFISGRNLRDKDFFSKSDPFVTFLIRDPVTSKWISQGRTETIWDNLNPNFTKSFITNFLFEVKQECRFEIWDDDNNGQAETLGYVETTIGKLMGAQKQISVLEITLNGQKKNQGKLVLRCDYLKESNQFAFIKMSAYKLMNTDGWFGKSDPFLRFYKVREDNSTQKIYETEVIMDNLNPNWKPFELSLARLCDGDMNRKFKIECLDWEKSGKFQFIGEIFITMAELQLKKDQLLKNPKQKNPGYLRIEQFQISIKPNFLDYIRGGLQLNQMIAVDFTGSNGIPTAPTSLHYMNPYQPNQYQHAITSVGEILLAYDFDQKVPCFGFGAKVHFPTLSSRETLHCFPLSGNTNNCEAWGLEQIMQQYQYALQHVELSGPTYFAPIINEAIKIASQLKQEEQDIYTILLILTDGEIHDMPQTKDLIVSASVLPLSIIIVGVGNADFGNMEILDGDQGLVNSRGQASSRDLVQFVPFRQFQGNQALLAQNVLAEIPDQVLKYFQLIGKKPNPPIMGDVNQMGFTQAPQSQVPNQIPPIQNQIQVPPQIPVQNPNDPYQKIIQNPQQQGQASNFTQQLQPEQRDPFQRATTMNHMPYQQNLQQPYQQQQPYRSSFDLTSVQTNYPQQSGYMPQAQQQNIGQYQPMNQQQPYSQPPPQYPGAMQQSQPYNIPPQQYNNPQLQQSQQHYGYPVAQQQSQQFGNSPTQQSGNFPPQQYGNPPPLPQQYGNPPPQQFGNNSQFYNSVSQPQQQGNNLPQQYNNPQPPPSYGNPLAPE